jgi:predicted RNA-binding protein with PUA-like domain
VPTKKTTTKKAAPKAKKKAAPKAAAAPKGPPVVEDEMDTASATAPYDKGKWAWVFKREPGEVRYWVVKSEPEIFSFDDLLRRHGRTTCWDGVRNFAARNFLRDGMKLNDHVFFYHSMEGSPMIVGECTVAREGYVDHTAFDPKHRHYDPASKQDDPQWYMVDLCAVAQFTRPVTLQAMKLKAALKDMALIRIGRLSVSPVTEKEYRTIRVMAGERS